MDASENKSPAYRGVAHSLGQNIAWSLGHQLHITLHFIKARILVVLQKLWGHIWDGKRNTFGDDIWERHLGCGWN
jgi:hypothetical protein